MGCCAASGAAALVGTCNQTSNLWTCLELWLLLAAGCWLQVVQVCAEHKKPAKLGKHLAAVQEGSKGLRNPPRVLIFANRCRPAAAAPRLASPLEANFGPARAFLPFWQKNMYAEEPAQGLDGAVWRALPGNRWPSGAWADAPERWRWCSAV